MYMSKNRLPTILMKAERWCRQQENIKDSTGRDTEKSKQDQSESHSDATRRSYRRSLSGEELLYFVPGQVLAENLTERYPKGLTGIFTEDLRQ